MRQINVSPGAAVLGKLVIMFALCLHHLQLMILNYFHPAKMKPDKFTLSLSQFFFIEPANNTRHFSIVILLV